MMVITLELTLASDGCPLSARSLSHDLSRHIDRRRRVSL